MLQDDAVIHCFGNSLCYRVIDVLTKKVSEIVNSAILCHFYVLTIGT